MKAILIGAGVDGLAAAAALENRGVSVRIYDTAPAEKRHDTGVSIWPNGARAIDAIGLAALRERAGHVLETGGIYTPDGGTIARFDSQTLIERYGAPVTVFTYNALLAGLRDAVTGEITSGKRISRYEQSATSITVHFTDRTFDTGNLLIGADGLHSNMRQLMHPNSAPVHSGAAIWQAVLSFPHDRTGSMWGETWGQGRRFGILPLHDDRIAWFATEKRAVNAPPRDHKAALLKPFDGWHDPIPAIITETPDDAIHYRDIYDIEPLNGWVDGLAVLVGNAAHAMTPSIGQPVNQTLEDAATLAEALADAESIPDALRAFDAARRPHTRRVMGQSRRTSQFVQVDNPLLNGLRDMGVRAAPETFTLQTLDYILAPKTERPTE